MKKLKKSIVNSNKLPVNNGIKSLFPAEIKSSRITINSRICNIDKFNQLFNILDNTQDYKNIISNYCYTNLTSIVSNYLTFLTNYTLFTSHYLNSWEAQTIFQEIAGHYSESAKRYLAKATFKVISPNSNISKIATFINSHSNLNVSFLTDNNSRINKLNNHKKDTYILDFNIKDNLLLLNNYLTKYTSDLEQLKLTLTLLQNKEEIVKFNKEIVSLEKKINSYHKLISTYTNIELLSINKPLLYKRLINLITTKKLRLLTKVQLGIYKTGTHARNFNNGQISIVKDITNKKYQYFLKVRKLNKLMGREPKLNIKNKLKNNYNYEELLNNFNDTNFIYLPLVFNHKKLKEINKTMDYLLIKNNPQVLIKSEQLRINQSSRKIHIIFNYESKNNLGKIIEHSIFNKSNIKPNEYNTTGVDVNIKNNLLADSNGIYYDQILKTNINNKNKFIDNVNEIVLLHSKDLIERTEKEKYRYEKLLRSNESLLKTYLSGIIKDWKAKNILHIVLEDLNFISDRTYYEHKEVKIKYSRLSRLLRIGQIKHWIASMAEKQGLFTHIINPAYTSQECNKCHYISSNNRKSQEVFKCMNPACKHKENADKNGAKVIKSRLINTNIRYKLGKDNVYFCSRTKEINYKLVKGIINSEYKLGVVNELLPNNPKGLKIKEDSLILF